MLDGKHRAQAQSHSMISVTVLPCNTSTIKELTIVWVSEEVLVTGLGELGVGTTIGAGGRTIYISLAFSFTTGGFVAVV